MFSFVRKTQLLLCSLCMIWAAIWQHLDIIFHVCDVITKRNDTSSDSSLCSETKRTVRVKLYVRDWRTPSPDRCLRSQCKQPSAARSSLEKRKCGLVVYCACYWDNNFKLKSNSAPKNLHLLKNDITPQAIQNVMRLFLHQNRFREM